MSYQKQCNANVGIRLSQQRSTRGSRPGAVRCIELTSEPTFAAMPCVAKPVFEIIVKDTSNIACELGGTSIDRNLIQIDRL